MVTVTNVEKGHFYIITKNGRKLDLGNIQHIESSYEYKISQKSITSMTLENAYVYDKGITHEVEVRFQRGQRTDTPVPSDKKSDWIYSKDVSLDEEHSTYDTNQWSNGFWLYNLYLIANRWQMNTDGIYICYFPAESDCYEEIGKSYTYYDEEGKEQTGYTPYNAYITSVSWSYTTQAHTSLSGTINFQIGSIMMRNPFEETMVYYNTNFASKTELQSLTESKFIKICDDDNATLAEYPARWVEYGRQQGKTVTFDKWKCLKKGTSTYIDVPIKDGKIDFTQIQGSNDTYNFVATYK